MGPIIDRTRENLTATDAAIVRFRRTVLEAVQALSDGTEPEAPRLHDYYKTRPGSWFAAEGVSFEDVLLERMSQGTSLLDMLNFDEHCANVAQGKESRLEFRV